MSTTLQYGIERRLERLEARLDQSPGLTWDELNVELLQAAWRIVADYGDGERLEPKSAAAVERCREHIAKTEAEIIREAAKWSHPNAVEADNYRWRMDTWRKRSGTEYVPPLLNPDSDWEAPNIMQRRAALRSTPEIAALLEQGKSRANNRSLQA